MIILLDECVPGGIRNSLPDHFCRTVSRAGLRGLKNGELLAKSEESGYEVLLTVDKGIAYQQSVTGRKISVLVIRAKSNKLDDLLPHIPACLSALAKIQSGQVIQVGDV